jgi:hypothetical protein
VFLGGFFWILDTALAFELFIAPYTVSLATLAASSVSIATSMALAKVRSSSLTLNKAFSIASLLTEHMNRVRSASSSGFLMDGKSHVIAS